MTIAQKSEQHPKGGQCTKHTGDNTGGAAPELGQWVYVTDENVGVDLVVTSGTAVVELTSSLPSEANDGSAVPFDWAPGAQAGAGKKSGVVSGATAVRLKLTAATTIATMSVRSGR